MLGPKPPRDAELFPCALPPHNKSVAVATAELLWAVALATTRASIVSTAHGLALWARMLRAPAATLPLIASAPASQPVGSRDASSIPLSGAATSAAPAQKAFSGAAPEDAPGEEAAAFASYRSPGGHAAAQVITEH
jgi:hypothetical protein